MTSEARRDSALRVYFDATATIRHHDGERTATHRLAVSVVGALLAFASSEAFVPDAMEIPLSLFGVLMCLNFYLITKKYEALVLRERGKASAAREVLGTLGDDVIILVDRNKSQIGKRTTLAAVPLQRLWSLFYLLLAMAFIYLAVRAALS